MKDALKIWSTNKPDEDAVEFVEALVSPPWHYSRKHSLHPSAWYIHSETGESRQELSSSSSSTVLDRAEKILIVEVWST